MIPHYDKQGSIRKRSQSKRVRRVVVSVIILLVIALVAYAAWYNLTWPLGRKGVYSHGYSLKVETNSTEEYVIRLPVPHDRSEMMPDDFLSELEVTMGVAELSLGTYDNETYLEIRSSASLNLEWERTIPDSMNERYGNLTLTTGAEGWSSHDQCYSWVYSSRIDIEMTFYYSSIHHYNVTPWWASGGGPTFRFWGHPLQSGWQQTLVDYGWLVID